MLYLLVYVLECSFLVEEKLNVARGVGQVSTGGKRRAFDNKFLFIVFSLNLFEENALECAKKSVNKIAGIKERFTTINVVKSGGVISEQREYPRTVFEDLDWTNIIMVLAGLPN